MGQFTQLILLSWIICFSHFTLAWIDGNADGYTDWTTDWEVSTDHPTDAHTDAPTEEPIGTCPDGWFDADYLGCFYFDNSKPDRHLSWVEAMDACDSMGGYLAELKTEEQANLIASIALVEESLTGVGSWWLGLSDMGHEGRWVWWHSVTETPYTAWAPGLPNADLHNTDDCIFMSISDDFLWRDVDCYKKTNAAPICQMDVGLDTTTTTAQSTYPPVPEVAVRLPTTTDSWNVAPGKVDAIDFISSEHILIRGISMFGSYYSGSHTHNGQIQLRETGSSSIIASERFQYTSDGSKDYFDHVFSSPGNVTEGVHYTITLEYDESAKIFYGRGGHANTPADCNGETVNFQFGEIPADTNGSDETRGQIPRILFSC